ncbi:MAG TPA: aminopeptidase N [Nocardioides sp.]|uniref:aminopeptidase N n=1 Tax=Nocardioides sp. TaxID=35761 RepID=UPI002C31CC66|nr:aminopeptidase N [Nocardioides sp.]HQR26882.1 aminopeptidase N [Nocardioides sp.]
MTATRSLTRTEATERGRQLLVHEYDVTLDLTLGERHFGSTTRIGFSTTGGPTFLDLQSARVLRITLDGDPLDSGALAHGRLPIAPAAGRHELVVDAMMRYRNDGEGLHRSVDPADGRHYVYAMCFMDAAPSVFACFDQPDLKAPLTLHVRAPQDWSVVGNAPGEQVEPGVWEFATTPPLSTYFVTVVAGPYHLLRTEHDGVPLGLSARASLATHLEKDAEELFTLTGQCFDEFHRLFGIRYPFGDYHQAFVPEFNAGAMENPGCVTFRDTLVFTSRVTRGERVNRATTIAHEMAHQWFGNLTTPVWWDDLWLNESFAEYMGIRVTADVTAFHEAWVTDSHLRRQWGLVADRRPSTHPVAGNGATDASSALQDFDGISYVKGSALLKLLSSTLGDEVFLSGAADHFRRHRFGNATMHDLFASWERAGAHDLAGFTTAWLRSAGADVLRLDRDRGVLTCTVPAPHPAHRRHRLRVATATSPGEWRTEEVEVEPPGTPFQVPPGTAVVLDPFEDTWAVPHLDPETVTALPALLPRTTDPMLRAGVWNGLAGTFHDGQVSPDAVLDVVEAALPTETADEVFQRRIRDVVERVATLSDDREAALARVHGAALSRLRTAPAGSTLQLAAFQTAVRSAPPGERLAAWRDGTDLPAGLELDEDLRWLVLVRLASLGATDRDELQRQLSSAPTAVARVEHVRAVASLPDPEAKAFAWAYFTGDTDAPNYEIEAAGAGLWRPGQEHLTRDYVARYFDELPRTAEVRQGWVLADAAGWFFPLTSVDAATLDRARALEARADLEPSLRRRLVDLTDELARRLAVRERFGR